MKIQFALLVATIGAIAMFLLGVYSGLGSKNIIIDSVDQDVQQIQDLLSESALDIKNLQLQQTIIGYLPEEQKCQYQELYVEYLVERLSEFYDVLPYRIEEYDKENEPTPHYEALKREYIRNAYRFWSVTSEAVRNCEHIDTIPLLYYYTADCQECVIQGEQLDKLKDQLTTSVIVLPIDLYFEEDVTTLLSQHYQVESTPTLIFQNKLTNGTLATAEELIEKLS